jgi:DNA-binding response OmpR family regulator
MAKHILPVDDDALLRRNLAFNLKQAGYHASTAASAEEALMSARVNPPDLVLLDIGAFHIPVHHFWNCLPLFHFSGIH